MDITYEKAGAGDIEPVYESCGKLIREYEDLEAIDYPRVMRWVRGKLEKAIGEYTVIRADGEKAGYYHFFRNDEGWLEIDDLYVFPAFRNRGIGTAVIRKCCTSVREPVMLYVFIKNEGAVSLYERLGFRVVETLRGSRYIMKNDNKKYYTAYEERYKTAHRQGVSWAGDKNSPIVLESIRKFDVSPDADLLEIGCGEGRDSRAVLDAGYKLLATDISEEAIAYCRKRMPRYEKHFRVLDCLSGRLDRSFDFIYAIAVIHMLVLDEDRKGFYQFIHGHLKPDGLALICTMGDGEFEMRSDINRAFELQERQHESGKMMVAGTSCRMVSFQTLEREITENGLMIVEEGITSALPDFNSLMYTVVKRQM